MCGIVGVAGKIIHPALTAFHNLIWVDAIRGVDNTGVVGVSRSNPDQWTVAKTEGDTSRLFEMKSYDRAVNAEKLCIIGHNRSKTIGDSAHRNAHPFSFTNIVGVHNGTLPYECRARFEKAGYKTETDSEGLYAHMNDNGVDATIKLMEGAWALVWYDKRNRTVNFLRNKERPLVYCFTDDRKTLYWASEVAMLYLTLNRHGIEFGGTKDTKPFHLTEDTLLSFVIPNNDGEFGKPTRQKMEAPKSFPTMGYSCGTGYGVNSSTAMTAGSRTPVARAFSNVRSIRDGITHMQPTTEEKENAYKPLGSTITNAEWFKLKLSHLQAADAPFYHGHSHHLHVDREAFDKIVSKGCSNCQVIPAWGEPVKFLHDNTIVCIECMLTNKDGIHELAADMM